MSVSRLQITPCAFVSACICVLVEGNSGAYYRLLDSVRQVRGGLILFSDYELKRKAVANLFS